MRFLAIGGEPATGKSHLMRAIVLALPPGLQFKVGLVSGTRHGDVYVLGSGYATDAPYPGTDRLSMGVQPHAEGFVAALTRNANACVLFEGDRLFNLKFLQCCAALGECEAWLLTVSEDEKVRRHHARADQQSVTFLRGRATKYANIARAFSVRAVPHGSDEEHRAAVERALTWAVRRPPLEGVSHPSNP